jgi:hypothetical protein
MQTQSSIKSKKGGVRPGAGRPTGYQAPATIKKIAIKVLQQVLQDETAPHEARVTAACKLIDEAKA